MRSKLTNDQKKQITAGNIQITAVRSCQVLSVSLGLYGTLFDGRGMSCLVIMAMIAGALQSILPARPGWLPDPDE